MNQSCIFENHEGLLQAGTRFVNLKKFSPLKTHRQYQSTTALKSTTVENVPGQKQLICFFFKDKQNLTENQILLRVEGSEFLYKYTRV